MPLIYDRKSLTTYLQWCKLFFKIGIFSACKTFRQHIFFGYELVDIRSVLVVFLKAVEKGITLKCDTQNAYSRFYDLQK